jgi:hypothetical protein
MDKMFGHSSRLGSTKADESISKRTSVLGLTGLGVLDHQPRAVYESSSRQHIMLGVFRRGGFVLICNLVPRLLQLLLFRTWLF